MRFYANLGIPTHLDLGLVQLLEVKVDILIAKKFQYLLLQLVSRIADIASLAADFLRIGNDLKGYLWPAQGRSEGKDSCLDGSSKGRRHNHRDDMVHRKLVTQFAALGHTQLSEAGITNVGGILVEK